MYKDVGREDSKVEEVNQENCVQGGLSLILQGSPRGQMESHSDPNRLP